MPSQASAILKELAAKKVIDFANDTFKIILMKPGFAFSAATHDGYADVLAEEHANGNGYTTGGATLSGVTVTRDDVLNQTVVSWNNPSWVMSGGNAQADGAIIYDDTVASPEVDPIIGFIDFGQTITVYDGGTFTIANVKVIIK